MSAVSSIALSGMHAASTRMDVAAHNIANAQTPKFHRQVVQQQSQESAGVMTSITQADQPGPDLATDIVEQTSASYAFKANLRSIRVQDELMGSLLDVHA
jgi:flagellar hook protein FlgE